MEQPIEQAPVASQPSSSPPADDQSAKEYFSVTVLNAGFITALILAGICLILAGVYMLRFQSLTSDAVNEVVHETMIQKRHSSVPSFENTDATYNMIRLALSTDMYMARILLLSCGIFVGLAFGFLGFCLFLIGVKGNVDANLSSGDRYKIQLARLSPGLFVILCSSLLIVICATYSLPVSVSESGGYDFTVPRSVSPFPLDTAAQNQDIDQHAQEADQAATHGDTNATH